MAKEFEIVDIWVGRFPGRQALAQYFQETYNEDDDETPISRLAADMGQRSYDHDLLEHSYHDQLSMNVLSRLAPHSFSRSYVKQACTAFERMSAPEFNTILLSLGGTIRRPSSVRGSDYSLLYLGRFACEPVS
jgi:hypothetical protein